MARNDQPEMWRNMQPVSIIMLLLYMYMYIFSCIHDNGCLFVLLLLFVFIFSIINFLLQYSTCVGMSPGNNTSSSSVSAVLLRYIIISHDLD